jgi:hypothetical protein
MTTKYTSGQPNEAEAYNLLTHAMERSVALAALVETMRVRIAETDDTTLIALASLAKREAEGLAHDLDHVDDVWCGNVVQVA